MSQKEITYKIISGEGHTEKTADAMSALADIQNMVKDQSKWLYVDKNHVANVNSLKVEDLAEAEDIMLTNMQVGG